MTALKIENLSKDYGGSAGAAALRDFSLEVADGELVAIVGPSGCGKSTLLRAIAGLEEETSGTVRLGGRVLNGRAPKDRDVALMFQSYTLLPHLTVAENLAFGLRLRGIPRAARETQARDTARLLGIENLLARLPSEISGGERQRVALGRAILRRPRAFLFDEPLSSLDAQMRLQLRVEIQRLHQRMQVPMLFVTHDQTEALTLGDRVVVLNRGVIQQVSPPDELYRRPANAFVASFIGSPGMNLFAGRVEEDPAALGLRFVSPALSFAVPPDREAAVRPTSKERAGITAGIRPEHLRPAEAGSAEAGGLLIGEVAASERQAGQTTLYHQHEGAGFAARVPGDFSVRPGAVARWTFDPADLFFFDANGARIP
ncbi:MAG: ugpC [Fibrobacteria bacterium]|nr:ugpC [Fibrobacteria bacterium]